MEIENFRFYRGLAILCPDRDREAESIKSLWQKAIRGETCNFHWYTVEPS